MEFTRTDVDGVPAFWTAGDGDFRAGLVFRVGQADETLPTRGITHLVEHLALHRLGVPTGLHHNGSVDDLLTHFTFHGDADQVTSSISELSRALHNLPWDRLEIEKNVLRTETQARGIGHNPLRNWRYGAAGYGLPSYPEFGISACTWAELAAWSTRYFTRGNSALWFTGGPPPAGLRLDLPDGEPMPPPAPAAVLLKTPAWFHEPNNDGIGFSALVERGHAAVAYTAILRRRLTAKLRYDLGIAYSPKAELTPRGAGVAELTAAAGALPQSRQTLVDSFARELDKLGIEPVSAAELRSAAEEFSTAAQTATAEAAFVVGCALDQVLGRTPPPSVAAMIERMSAVTPDAVQAIAIQALDSGLYALPAAADLQRPHVVRAVSQSPCELSGMKFRSRDYPWDKSWLVMAAEGVAVADGAQQVTVRYADCAALLAWPDGGRTIIGRDGLAIRIEPTLWRMSDSVAGKVDHAVLPELRIAMPARAVDKVPEPATGHVRRAVGWLLRSPRAARLLGAAAGLAAAIGVIADIPHASSLGFLTLPAAALGAQGAMIARRRLILRARPRLTR